MKKEPKKVRCDICHKSFLTKHGMRVHRVGHIVSPESAVHFFAPSCERGSTSGQLLRAEAASCAGGSFRKFSDLRRPP
jgi:hypothetical protein